MTISVAVADDAAAGVCKYTITWQADSAGNVTGAWPMKVGFVWLVEHCPATDPKAQPAGLYNMQITNDADGADILGGSGVNISNAGPTFDTPLAGTSYQPALVAGGNVTMTVSGAGKGAAGTVVLVVGGFNRFSARR
jgi:hypothetical protein